MTFYLIGNVQKSYDTFHIVTTKTFSYEWNKVTSDFKIGVNLFKDVIINSIVVEDINIKGYVEVVKATLSFPEVENYGRKYVKPKLFVLSSQSVTFMEEINSNMRDKLNLKFKYINIENTLKNEHFVTVNISGIWKENVFDLTSIIKQVVMKHIGFVRQLGLIIVPDATGNNVVKFKERKISLLLKYRIKGECFCTLQML